VKGGLVLAGFLGLGMTIVGSIEHGRAVSQPEPDSIPIRNSATPAAGAVGRSALPNTRSASLDKNVPRPERPGTPPLMIRQTMLHGALGAPEKIRAYEAAASRQPSPPLATGIPTSHDFEIGDKIKIVFYEHVVDVEANKWGGQNSALHGFQERPELSGEYTVQEDGTIALPLLGSFMVTDCKPLELQSALARSFEKLTGRQALVTILSVHRPPVYVLGPVKNPGSYKYTPGMTVLQAIALAGGFATQSVEPWEQLEAIRATENRRGSIEEMATLLARVAVLESERDDTAVQPSSRLVELVGDVQAEKLVAAAAARRSSTVSARRIEALALTVSLQDAKQQLQTLSRHQQPLNDLIKLRQERVNAMKTLMAKGMVNWIVLNQAESDLMDAEQRQQEAANQYVAAQQQVARLEGQRATFQANVKSQIETELAATEQQITADERQFATSQGVLGALTDIQYAQPSPGTRLAYEIVRQTATGPVALAADGLTTLQPGDLVRVIFQRMGGGADSAQPTVRPAAADARTNRMPVVSQIRDLSMR
jgi:protein involved in polysaccharide export with SLBB domain